MAQLDVYENPDEDSRTEVPFLLDIQHDVHFQLRTRLVVPLVRAEIQRVGIDRLCPAFSIEDQAVFASVPEMASYPASELDRKVASLMGRRDEIFKAMISFCRALNALHIKFTVFALPLPPNST